MNHTINTDDWNKYEGNNIYLADEDMSSSSTLDKTLSLAATLEEDRDRYQDVVRDLIEFEEVLVQVEAGVVTTTEELHDLDTRHEASVS